MDEKFKAYRITNRVNGRVYIGITSGSLKRRWGAHVQYALAQNGRGPLQAAIRKYGAEAFTMEHISTCRSWSDLCQTEIALIEQHGSFGNGYNATKGAQGAHGVIRSAKTIRLRVESYKRTLASKGGCILKGRPRGPDVSAHLSKVLTGRTFSAETRAKMSVSQKKRVRTQAEMDRFQRDGDKRRIANRSLSDEQVSFMRSQRAEGVRFSDLARYYGITESMAQFVAKGRIYKHVPMPAWGA